MSGIDQREFRNALGRFATGVTVITCRGVGGKPEGLTANSFSAVSLDPPLVLWCLAKSAPSLQAFVETGHFAINVLAEDQMDLSNRFATPAEDKFDGIDWDAGLGGAPVLPGTLARFECRNETHHEGGDHLIFIGAVEDFTAADGAPILFAGGRYGKVARFPEGGGASAAAQEFEDLLI